jgi:hypothetical protein
MFRFAILCVIFALNYPLRAQEGPHIPSEGQLAEIAARGRALAEYDAAAWHASDAVEATHPDKSTIQRYVARKTDKGWIVVWGRYNEAGTKFLIAYEAQQQGNSNDYMVTKHDPPVEDSDFYFQAARAHQLGTSEFFREVKPHRPYNISVLPTADRQWYVYAIPAQTDAGILPYGGDVRYTISADGTQIIEKRQMHKTVLEENIVKSPEFDFHTHILSDVPEDSDVFYALTRRAAHGEWLGTKNYFYEIGPSGSLRYLGTTAEIVKLLQSGEAPVPEGPYRAMLLSAAQRLLSGTGSGQALEAFTSFSGARCTDGTLWLKFATVLHNAGDKKIILYKDPLRNSQARFGATETEIRSGKYEKLAFASFDKVDLSIDDSYIALSPGMVYSHEQEYPMLGIDLKGKAAVQFLFFTWPLGEEKQIEPQRSRLEGAGYLYADTVLASPVALTIDPELLEDCPPKK